MARRFFRVLVLALGLAPLAASANSPKGIAAYGRGDYATAFREFKQAAEAGDTDSQYMLGRLYAMGLGAKPDYVQAWIWDQRAANGGSREANAARADMEAILTPAQRTSAQAAFPVPPSAPPVAIVDMGTIPPFPPGSQIAMTPEGMSEITTPRQVELHPRQRGVEQVHLIAPEEQVHLTAPPPMESQITIVQRDLAIAGYDPGPADGKLNRRTRKAIHDWQRDHAEPPTGRISDDVVTQLEAARLDKSN